MNNDNVYIKEEDEKDDKKSVKGPSLRDINKENNVSKTMTFLKPCQNPTLLIISFTIG